jgi:multisubunit Na+/H+ antiporter MnhG subunit
MSSVAIVPTLFGPLLANMYLRKYDSELYQLLHQGGSIIVQLSFFFAGFIGLIFYLYSRISQREKIKNYIHLTFVLAIFGMMLFTGKDFMHGEILSAIGVLPPVTCLLISRAIITINVVAAATWPKTQNNNREKDTQ